MPQDLRQIQWTEYGQTVLHPLSLLILVIMVVVLLQSRRVYILIPFLVVGAFLTHMQRLVIGSFDFSMLRLLLIAGVGRALIRNDVRRIDWRGMDSAFLAYVIIASVSYVMLWQNTTAITNRLGFAFEALLAFFLIRVYVSSTAQVKVLVRAFALVFAVVAIFMFIERYTRYNFFSIFGGVPALTRMREG